MPLSVRAVPPHNALCFGYILPSALSGRPQKRSLCLRNSELQEGEYFSSESVDAPWRWDSEHALMLAGRPGQKPDERTSAAGKEGDAEIQDANAEGDEEEPQEQGDMEADGALEGAAHPGESMERETDKSGKVGDFIICMNTLLLNVV